MAFATNLAAFGMKPATTSKAQGNPLFGGSQQNTTPAFNALNALGTQPQSTTPAFNALGGSQQNTTPAFNALNALGAQPQNTTPAFNAWNALGAQSQHTTPAFNALGAQPQNQGQAQNVSLFGTPLNQAPQQNQSNPLFGSSTQPQQSQSGTQQTQQNAFGSSLFGSQNPQQNSFTAYGNSTTSANTGPTLGQSLIAGWNAQQQQQPQQQQQQSTGAFGTRALGTVTSSVWGKPAQPQNQSWASQQVGPPQFTKSTKFNDLPDDIKKTFENIDAHMQGRIQISKELKERKLGDEPNKGLELMRVVHQDLVHAISTLQSDAHHTRDLKEKVDQTVQDTIVATRIVDGFRNPQQNGAYLKNHANFPLEFFQRVTEQMKERLRWYKSTIEQIERKLSVSAAQAHYTPQAITSTLEAQHATFIALASKTAALDAELQKIKAVYTQMWRARTGSMRDPFNDLDRGSGAEFGIGGLSA